MRWHPKPAVEFWIAEQRALGCVRVEMAAHYMQASGGSLLPESGLNRPALPVTDNNGVPLERRKLLSFLNLFAAFRFLIREWQGRRDLFKRHVPAMHQGEGVKTRQNEDRK